MIRKPEIVSVPNLRGGEGTIEIHHIVSKDELLGHGTMYAKLVLPPHSSIGWHKHETNTEPFYVLKGKGIFTDNDGSKTEIVPGDVCTIEVGQSHSIENPFEEPLEVMALVYNDRV